MKQLFWKEWYELRWLPLASAVCVALLIVAAKAFSHIYDRQPFQVGETLLPLLATWMLLGLLAGAGLFAQEVGSGSLTFLSALPTSRRRLWWVKASTAFGMLLLSVLAGTAAWAIIDLGLFQSAFFQAPWWQETARAFWLGVGGLLLVLLFLFAVALAVSSLLDRPVSVVITALLVAYSYVALLSNVPRLYLNSPVPHLLNGDQILMLLVALSVPVFGTISYWTFTRGETLRSAKRFRVGATAGAVSLVIAALVFVLLLNGPLAESPANTVLPRYALTATQMNPQTGVINTVTTDLTKTPGAIIQKTVRGVKLSDLAGHSASQVYLDTTRLRIVSPHVNSWLLRDKAGRGLLLTNNAPRPLILVNRTSASLSVVGQAGPLSLPPHSLTILNHPLYPLTVNIPGSNSSARVSIPKTHLPVTIIRNEMNSPQRNEIIYGDAKTVTNLG